jgi:hypothetical protein
MPTDPPLSRRRSPSPEPPAHKSSDPRLSIPPPPKRSDRSIHRVDHYPSSNPRRSRDSPPPRRRSRSPEESARLSLSKPGKRRDSPPPRHRSRSPDRHSPPPVLIVDASGILLHLDVGVPPQIDLLDPHNQILGAALIHLLSGGVIDHHVTLYPLVIPMSRNIVVVHLYHIAAVRGLTDRRNGWSVGRTIHGREELQIVKKRRKAICGGAG